MKFRRKNRGFVVVIALIALMAMSFFLLTGVRTTATSVKVSGNYTKTIDGFNLAEAGLAKARPIIETTAYADLLTDYAQTSTALIAPTTFNRGTYEVWISDNDDGDGNPYADADDIIVARSIGTNETGGNVIIEAYLQKPTVSSPQPFPPDPAGGTGAALFCGTTTDVKTQGSAFISGHDYTPPELPCSGSGCNGTDLGGGGYAVIGQGAINTTGSGYVSNLTPKTKPNVSDTSCGSWRTLRDELAALDPSSPHVQVLSGSGTGATLNTCDEPKVFIINTSSSTYTFSGNASLCGLVVVASNTAVAATGTSTIIGSVLVMGAAASLGFVATSGTPNFFGQIIVESNTADSQKELDLKGNVRVVYSSAGVGYANEAMNNALGNTGGGGGDGLITMAWKETY